jgi:hypothetical protein
MNFGYLIIVSSSSSIDYLKLAYALALSIKNTQKEGYDKVALVIDDRSKLDQLTDVWVFDHVIQWDQETFWDGRSWMDQLSPWDNTVCLDADMIFLRDYSHWIDYFVKNCDLYIANKSYSYRGQIVTDDYYRKTFTANNLPNLYSFYTFFKKNSNIVNDFFTLGRYILKYPIEFKNLYFDKHKPQVVGTDEAFALSSKILGIEDQIAFDLDFPKIVHMKPMIQNWPWPANKWTDHVGFYINRTGNVKIGNFQQDSILHYVEKDLITDEVVNILEEIAWKKN